MTDTKHKPTHYSMIHHFRYISTPKFRLFEFTDLNNPNRLVFSTNSQSRFNIQLDLIGLKELNELREEDGFVTYSYYCS